VVSGSPSRKRSPLRGGLLERDCFLKALATHLPIRLLFRDSGMMPESDWADQAYSRDA
jgi:hypothetical protein